MLKIFYVHFEFEYHVTRSGYLRKNLVNIMVNDVVNFDLKIFYR